MGAEGTDNAQTVTELHLDCYAILGVRPDAEEFVIREAFETLTRQYDPEHFAGSEDEAHRKLSDLASAYAILSDPVRRRRYDLRRRIDALIAPLTANDAQRQKGSPPAVVDHSKVTLGPRRNQVLLPAVLGALIVVAVATVYQYSGRPSVERQGSSAAVPPVAADTKPAAITQPPAQPPAQPTIPRAEIPTRPSDAGASGAVASPAASPAAPALQEETVAPLPKPAVAKSPPINRAGDASPAAVASESCSDVGTVLGLCKRKSTAKEK